jgi:hypothetical protein
MRGVLESRRGFKVDTAGLLCEVSTDTIYFVVLGRFWYDDALTFAFISICLKLYMVHSVV